MKFKDIVGQKPIINSLRNIIENKSIGHAYIFSGPDGSGKSTVAFLFASSIMCMNNNADFYDKPCGKCHACLMISDGNHPDLKFIADSGEKSISVETIRELQIDTGIRPLYTDRKIYIIKNGEKMTEQAQNCILKTFEEPNEYVTIIITTSNYQALLNTIRSRAVKYEFKPNTKQEIIEVLCKRDNKYSREKALLAYNLSEGSIGKAIYVIDSQDFMALRQKSIDIANRLLDCSMIECLEYVAFFETNANRLDDVLNIIILWYRDLYAAACGAKDDVLINFDNKDIILKNADRVPPKRLYKILHDIEYAREAIKRNVNFQLSVEYMLMMIRGETV